MTATVVRSKEEANLLNPAFCCNCLAASLFGYSDVSKSDMPFALTFMILPIILHKPTRQILPPSTRTSMAAWLSENQSAKVLFYERLMALRPFTREAIHFGMKVNWISPVSGGLIHSSLGEKEINRISKNLTDEVHECFMRSRFLGRWFASVGQTSTLMAFWGIRP